MAIRNWRTIVEEADGRDFSTEANTVEAYRFGGNRKKQRVFKVTEPPGRPYRWVEED